MEADQREIKNRLAVNARLRPPCLRVCERLSQIDENTREHIFLLLFHSMSLFIFVLIQF